MPGVTAVLRAVLVVAGLVAGVAAGVLGSFVHALDLAGLPLGLLVALALSASVVLTAALAAGRGVSAAAALGWLGAVLVLSGQRPEGDLVVANTVAGQVWLFAGTALVGAAVVVPLGRLLAAAPTAPHEDGR